MKAQVIEQLEDALQHTLPNEIIALIGNWMSVDDLQEFLQFVKKEGYGEPEEEVDLDIDPVSYKNSWKAPTKQSVLAEFKQEYQTAVAPYQGDNIDDYEPGQKVLDKYMNMDTDLFDASDLEEIVDQVDEERYYEPKADN